MHAQMAIDIDPWVSLTAVTDNRFVLGNLPLEEERNSAMLGLLAGYKVHKITAVLTL